MNEPDDLARDVRELEALLKSRAWQLITEALEADILAAAKGFAASPVMTEKEIDFRRGAIHAAMGFAGTPAILLNALRAQLLLASAGVADSQQPFTPDASA
jgi:hypothetical protein